MRHDRWMVDQTFDTTEGFGQGKQLAALHHASRFGQTTAHIQADHAAEASHLLFRQCVLWMRG